MSNDDWVSIKIRASTHGVVKSLSEKTGLPIYVIIDEAVTQYAASMNQMDEDECGGACINLLLLVLNAIIARPWDYKDYILRPVHVKFGGFGFTPIPLPPWVAEVRLKLNSTALKELIMSTVKVPERTAENCAVAILRNIQTLAKARTCLPGLDQKIKYWEVKYGTLRAVLEISLGKKKLARLKQSGLLKGGGK